MEHLCCSRKKGNRDVSQIRHLSISKRKCQSAIIYCFSTPPPRVETGSPIKETHTKNSLIFDWHLINPGGRNQINL